jgi:hypothetical protein
MKTVLQTAFVVGKPPGQRYIHWLLKAHFILTLVVTPKWKNINYFNKIEKGLSVPTSFHATVN